MGRVVFQKLEGGHCLKACNIQRELITFIHKCLGLMLSKTQFDKFDGMRGGEEEGSGERGEG